MKRAYTDDHACGGLDAPLPEIETWPNQFRDYEIEIDLPEFSSVCPKTGLPDFGRLLLRYVPDKACLELKSYKMYLLAYRDLGIFQENIVNRVLRDVVHAAQPVGATVIGDFTPRGGLSTLITAAWSRQTAAGHKTAGRGNKGQKSRSGYSGKVGFEGGQMPLQRRLPKRGFTNIFRKQWTEVTLAALEQHFEAGDEITPATMLLRGVVAKGKRDVVVLGTGELTKALTVSAHRFTKAVEPLFVLRRGCGTAGARDQTGQALDEFAFLGERGPDAIERFHQLKRRRRFLPRRGVVE